MSRSNTFLPASRASIRLCLGCLLILGVAFSLLVFSPPRVHAAEPLSVNATWTLEIPSSEGWVSRPATVSVTIVDPDELWNLPTTSGYRYSTDTGATWSAWLSDDSFEFVLLTPTTARMTATIESLIDSETENQVQFHVRDRDSFTEEISEAYTLKVDVVPPSAPLSLGATPSGWTSTNSFDLSWTNPTDASGIAWAHYKLDTPPSDPEDSDGSQEGEDITSLSDISVGSPGRHTAYVWLDDGAGNSGYTRTASVELYFNGTSAPPPPIGLQVTPTGWTATNAFSANWSNPSTPSEIQAAWYRWDTAPSHAEDGTRVAGANIKALNGLTVAGDGERALYVWLEDSAGLKSHSNASSAYAHYDITPPETTYSFSPPLPPSGWYNKDQSVTVSLNGTDAGSQVDETRWRREGGLWNNGSSFVATESRSYEFYSTDHAGNVEEIKTLSVQIDKIPPVSVWRLDPPEPAGGWYSSTVTIHLTATDTLPGSGWSGYLRHRLDGGSWQMGGEAAVTTDGIHRIEFYARDVAGNDESPQSVDPVCRIDRTPPETNAIANKNGDFIRPPVTISLSAVDALNGVARIEYRRQGDSAWMVGTSVVIDGSAGDGLYTYEYRATDTVGNVSLPKTIALSIDGTPPGQPTGLASDPSLWSNVNGQFGLIWTNPTDFSGIAGVYYQLDVDPTVTLAPSFVAGDAIQSLTDLTVAGEGEHTIYVWLKDHAGNASEYANRSLAGAFKYDASPPNVNPAVVDGDLGDDGLHYRGPVQITISGTDMWSRVTSYSYRVNSGDWFTGTVHGDNPYIFAFSQPGRNTIGYRATDLAGNLATEQELTVRIDSTPPTPPSALTATPPSWTNVNNFQVCWTGWDDYSLVGAAYYKVGEPPVHHTDGTRVPLPGGQSCVSGLTLDQQGEVPVYVWLQDRAGNVNYGTARAISLRLDTAAPTTDLDPTGTLGDNSYYVSPISVRFAASDEAGGAVSGVKRTFYKIGGAPATEWDGEDLHLDQEGEHEIEFWSTDVAGNEERPHRRQIYKIDLYAPLATLWAPSDYSPTTSFNVKWLGTDSESGVAKYRVQYRAGSCTFWQDWLPATANTQGTFSAPAPNHFYYFRAQATDRAGRLSAWSDLGQATYAYVEGLANAGFDQGTLTAWSRNGQLNVDVVYQWGPYGSMSDMARIGNESACLSTPPADSYGSLSQRIVLPDLGCEAGLLLAYNYRIQTYDVAWGKLGDSFGWIDPFVVYVRDTYGNELARFMPSGNRTDYTQWEDCGISGSFYDSGWRSDTIDLSGWAGQDLLIDFRTLNGADVNWPTWTLLDNVRLLPAAGRVARVPLVLRSARAGLAALPSVQGDVPEPAPLAPQTKSGRPSRR